MIHSNRHTIRRVVGVRGMSRLSGVSFPHFWHLKWLSKKKPTPWIVPRAISVTSNSCKASNLKVLRMQQLSEKCCTGKAGSNCCDINGSCRGDDEGKKTFCSSRPLRLQENGVDKPTLGATSTSAPSGKPQFYRYHE